MSDWDDRYGEVLRQAYHQLLKTYETEPWKLSADVRTKLEETGRGRSKRLTLIQGGKT